MFRALGFLFATLGVLWSFTTPVAGQATDIGKTEAIETKSNETQSGQVKLDDGDSENGEGESESSEQSLEVEKQASVFLPLPNQDATGRPVWPIGVYQSQLVDVIPENFRAVSIDDLQKALASRDLGEDSLGECRVSSGFYDVRLEDGILESSRTELLIAHRGSGISYARLGTVNLAIHRGIENTQSDGTNTRAPRLEVDESGALYAVVADPLESNGDEGAQAESANEETVSKVPFSWSLRGETVDEATNFVLQIPRASQTRMVLSTPKDVRLQSRHGVLIERPSPPPDADLTSRDLESRWYVLEAGGLDRIELTAVRDAKLGENATILVRRESKQYEVERSGMTWTHRLNLDAVRPQEKLRLRCTVGTVASVRVDSIRVDPKLVETSENGTVIEIQLPDVAEVPDQARENETTVDSAPTLPTILTVTGNASWDLTSGICDLPSIEFESPRVIRCEPETQAVVTVLDSISIADWSLPAGWTQSAESPNQAESTLLLAQGPPGEIGTDRFAWSRLLLSGRSSFSMEPTLLRLQLEQEPTPLVRGVARLRFRNMDPIVPIHLEIEPGWTVADVTALKSGRKIAFDSGRELHVWPEHGDVDSGAFDLEIVGQRSLRPDSETLKLPSIWMVQPLDRFTQQVIAIQPPKRRRWDANSVLLDKRILLEDLTEQERSFLEPNSDTLLLGGTHEGTVSASLEPTRITYDVTVRHGLAMNNGRVLETIGVRTDASTSVPTLTIQTGRIDGDRSTFRWSLRNIDGSEVLTVPDAQVSLSSDTETETYTIRLDDRDLDVYEVFGRRLYEPTERIRVVLPSVRGATTQTAETELSSDLSVVDLPANVQLVPTGDQSNERDGQKLRYDSTNWQAVEIELTASRSKACLVWKQSLNVVASSRGQDVFHLSALVSSQSPAVITFAPGLELVSVRRNGLTLPVETLRQRRIRVEPEKQTDQIAVTLIRRHNSSTWFRSCDVPEISVQGHILSRETFFTANSESVLLPTLFGNTDSSSRSSVIVPRNVCLAIAWLLAGLIFVGSWTIARAVHFWPRLLMLGTILTVGASIIWWPYQQALIAWAALPIGLAGLFHASMTWSNRTGRKATAKQTARESSADFSFTRLAWLSLIAGLCFAGSAIGQTRPAEREPEPNPTPINLMVPMNDQHELVGNKVYLSEQDFQEIVSRSDPSRPVAARIQDAEYRVFLELDRDAGSGLSSAIEADYEVQVARRATQVRLPVPAEFVRRVELIGDNQRRILRHTVNARGTIDVPVPPGEFFRLRVNFQPDIESLAQPNDGGLDSETIDSETPPQDPNSGLSVVRLRIPKVHSARVNVEAPRQILVDSLGETIGRTVKDVDVARYSADLGPVDQLAITCRPASRSGSSTEQVGRRSYRVSVGLRQAYVECEVVPARRLNQGESTDLIVVGARPSLIHSPGWTIERVIGASEETATDPAQRSATFRLTKRGNHQAPIRFAWTLPLEINETDPGLTVPIPIPEILRGTSSRNVETLFGFELDGRLQLDNQGGTAWSADTFSETWRGYRGTIDQCFRATELFPSFLVSLPPQTVPRISIEQRLHLSSTKMQLRFRADLSDPDPNVKHFLLTPPEGFEVLRCSINGDSLPQVSSTKSVRTPIPIGDRRLDGEMSIEVIAEMARKRPGSIKLPRFELNHNAAAEEAYTISHDQQTLVAWDRNSPSSDTPESAAWKTVDFDQASLLEGRVPFASKQASNGITFDGELRLRHSTKPRGTRFRSTQSSTMAYAAGRWSCRTLIEVPRRQCPPFLDIAMPTRWAADLRVTGGVETVSRVSADDATTVVRVAFPRTTDLPPKQQHMVCELNGFLDTTDQVRVSVPAVTVLGDGNRERYVAVPNRLTAELIRWRSGGGARTITDGGTKIDVLSEISPESHTFYRVDGTNWAIDLEPLSPASEEPIATIGDARVLLESDKAFVLQRFDLAPETQNAVAISVPPRSEVIGVWSAGREVERDNEPDGALIIPLAYSRLGQSLEILIQVDVSSKPIDDYLPVLRDIPVSKQWVAFYNADSDPFASRAALVMRGRDEPIQAIREQADEWRLQLGESIVAVVERSRDTLADRSSDEVRRWLLPWLARYRQLALMSGVQFDSEGGLSASTLNANASSWKSLQSSLSSAIGEQLESETETESFTSLFDEDRFSTYELQQVIELNEDALALPPIKLSYPKVSPARRILLDGLTLLMIGLVFVLAWPFRGRLADLVSHPLVWVVLVAIPMLFLAPAPVAIATLLIAILPLSVRQLNLAWNFLSHRS